MRRTSSFLLCALTAAILTPAEAAAQSREISIDAQDARAAVLELSAQTNAQILLSGDVGMGKKTNSVRGARTVEDALQAMFAGTGLQARKSGASAWVVVAAPPSVKSAHQASPSEDARQDDVVADDTVIVTAFGREQLLRETPLSLLASPGEDLVKFAIDDAQSFAIRQPGFRVSPSPASDYIFVRGVGSSANPLFEQSVSTFLDGVYRGRSRDIRTAFFDLERVELLRGPQATFFGNNTIAGALNLVSRKPGDVLSANGSAYYEPEYGEYVVEGGVDIPASDRAALRIAARKSGGGGYIENSNTAQSGPDEDQFIGRISLGWRPTDRITIDARVDGGQMRDKGIFNVELTECPPPAAFGTVAGPCARFLASQGGVIDNVVDYRSEANASSYDSDFLEGAVTTNIELGDFDLLLRSAYFNRQYELLNDPIAVPGIKGGSAIGTTTALPLLVGEKFNQFSQEVRLLSPEEADWSYVLGAYYQRGNINVYSFQGFYFLDYAALSRGVLPARTPIATYNPTREESENISVFGALTWKPTSDLRFNAGVRSIEVDKTANRAVYAGTAGDIPNQRFTSFSSAIQSAILQLTRTTGGDFPDPDRADSKVLYSASAQYSFGHAAELYAAFSQGFKAGGFAGASLTQFAPESADAFEIGVKGTAFDRRINYSLSLFDSEYKDLQESTTVQQGAAFVSIVTNAAKSNVRGVEFSGAARLTPELTLATNLSYLSSKYDDYPNAPCTSLQAALANPCLQDLTGARRAFAPLWSGNASIAYKHPIFDELQITFDGLAYFSSRYYVLPIADDRLRQPSFVKLDARIALGRMDGAWEMALVGRNLTDEQTATWRQTIPGSAGPIGVLPEPPRTVAVQFTFRR